MSSTAIVNTGLCNLDSIARAIEDCGGKALVTEDPRDIERAGHIILPGVGAFPEAMARLRSLGLDAALSERVIARQIPFLGVCLGMQLMAEWGTEVRKTPGLGWIDGEVRLLHPQPGERIPHIGWNSVELIVPGELFRGIDADRDFYFVHSYVLRASRRGDVTSVTSYGGGFVSSVNRGNIFGVQFHPEKSQQAGFAVLRNFLAV